MHELGEKSEKVYLLLQLLVLDSQLHGLGLHSCQLLLPVRKLFVALPQQLRHLSIELRLLA